MVKESETDCQLLKQNNGKNKNVRFAKSSALKDCQKEFGIAKSVEKNSHTTPTT